MAVSFGWRNRCLLLIPLLLALPLLLSVSELHRSLKPVETQSRRQKKFDHLVLGPAAGQGLPNRLQCQGLRALNKRQPASSNQNQGGNISFVTVFTVYNSSLYSDRPEDHVNVGSILYSKTGRSIAILNTFVNFIQVSMPRSNVFILTDPTSQFSLDRTGVSVFPIEGDYSRGNLMLQRIRSYIAFLDARSEDNKKGKEYVNHYIFSDSDIAVVDDLRHVFLRYPEFHFALTFRNNKDQPLNSGFIAVRGTQEGLIRAKVFLQEVLNIYSSKYMKASRMLGDQLALAWVVKSNFPFAAKRFSRPEIFSSEIVGATVLFLPCAIYNWTPPEGAGQFHGMPIDIKVVHFKGSRKRLMLESWNYFNRTSNIPDMLCMILKSGRTKYDF